jgi:hypothetical protein
VNPLILKPQFIDRGGRTVYNVYEDDPDCRILRPGKFIGQMRWDHDKESDPQFEEVQGDMLDGHGTG